MRRDYQVNNSSSKSSEKSSSDQETQAIGRSGATPEGSSSLSSDDSNIVRELEYQESTLEFSSLTNSDQNNHDQIDDETNKLNLANSAVIEISTSSKGACQGVDLNARPGPALVSKLSKMGGSVEDGSSLGVYKKPASSNYAKSPSLFRFREPKSKESSEHFTINWHKLDFVRESKWYKLASQRKPILSGLSGEIKSGELTAILGPSGAGKSTLIDCLIGKHERGLSGRTQVNFSDQELEAERRKRRPLKIALIPQKDHLLETLTVMETFMFASRIKNAHLKYEEEEEGLEYEEGGVATGKISPSLDKDGTRRRPFDHFANVQRVLAQLHLSSCASLRCGKLSGGQYKRVSIGQELLSRPDLMILDEPTSGLDSVTCFNTIRALRELIDDSPYPMAIVATIHQPDVEVFDLFHKSYVLASGGRAIYEGPSEDIFPTIRAALKMVETRRAVWKLDQKDQKQLAASSETFEAQLALGVQLEEERANPARLIVEVAAQTYGYEISNALAELQSRRHELCELADTPSNLSSRTELTRVESTSSCCSTSIHQMEQLAVSSEPMRAAALRPSSIPPPIKGRRPQQDQLLNLMKANSVRRSAGCLVWSKHLWYHTQRSWLTILRDPMLFWVQLGLHIFVPLLISYSFQNQNSAEHGDACPRVGQLDVVKEAYRMNGTVLDDLNSELRTAFENIGYMFFQIYVIIFAAVCVTSLTYPLVMHVLLKEYRNGWYSLSSYFLGRTLADLPIPAFNVVLAMAISYHLTGQPNSPYLWRFCSVGLLTVLATLVAQTWGLIFGALLMNLPQSAVFVAPASTAPLVVVSGFLIRISKLPPLLQHLSKLSYFTYLLNGVIVARYGFNRCPCSEEDFEISPAHQVPQQARGLIDIWIGSFASEFISNVTTTSSRSPPSNITNTSTNPEQVDLVGKLVDTISTAQTFGHQLDECSQVKPFTMLDYELEDWHLFLCFAALALMLIFFRWATYIVLSWKISSSL